MATACHHAQAATTSNPLLYHAKNAPHYALHVTITPIA